MSKRIEQKMMLSVLLDVEEKSVAQAVNEIHRVAEASKGVEFNNKNLQEAVKNFQEIAKSQEKLNSMQLSMSRMDSKLSTGDRFNEYMVGTGKGARFSDLNKAIKELEANADTPFARMKNGMERLKEPFQATEGWVTKLSKTVMNSLRYTTINTMVDSLRGAASDATKYYADLDKNITNIRIVSGKSRESAEELRKTAEIYGEALNVSTNTYLRASEIYYQQGLSTGEVQDRTTATIQAANVSGQSVEDTANQVTAVLNGFNIESSKTVDVLDKIANLGASTASSFEEISKGAQKMASSASEAQIPLEDTLAMIATVSAVTREAPESVGTSLNTIISRFSNLIAEDGEYKSKIETAFQETESGLSIYDNDGLLRSRVDILEDIAKIWDKIDVNQKAAIASAAAGTRQYNRFAALVGNWDTFETFRDIAEDSEGTLDYQAGVYAESLESLQNSLLLSKEKFAKEFFDVESYKKVIKFFDHIYQLLEKITSTFGGVFSLAPTALAPVFGVVANQLSQHYQDKRAGDRLKEFTPEEFSNITEIKEGLINSNDIENQKRFADLVDLVANKQKILSRASSDERQGLERKIKLAEEYLDLKLEEHRITKDLTQEGVEKGALAKFQSQKSLRDGEAFDTDIGYEEKFNLTQRRSSTLRLRKLYDYETAFKEMDTVEEALKEAADIYREELEERKEEINNSTVTEIEKTIEENLKAIKENFNENIKSEVAASSDKLNLKGAERLKRQERKEENQKLIALRKLERGAESIYRDELAPGLEDIYRTETEELIKDLKDSSKEAEVSLVEYQNRLQAQIEKLIKDSKAIPDYLDVSGIGKDLVESLPNIGEQIVDLSGLERQKSLIEKLQRDAGSLEKSELKELYEGMYGELESLQNFEWSRAKELEAILTNAQNVPNGIEAYASMIAQSIPATFRDGEVQIADEGAFAEFKEELEDIRNQMIDELHNTAKEYLKPLSEISLTTKTGVINADDFITTDKEAFKNFMTKDLEKLQKAYAEEAEGISEEITELLGKSELEESDIQRIKETRQKISEAIFESIEQAPEIKQELLKDTQEGLSKFKESDVDKLADEGKKHRNAIMAQDMTRIVASMTGAGVSIFDAMTTLEKGSSKTQKSLGAAIQGANAFSAALLKLGDVTKDKSGLLGKLSEKIFKFSGVLGPLSSTVVPLLGNAIVGLVSKLGLFDSELERINKQVSKFDAANKALTNTLREQTNLLPSINRIYNDLGSKYNETPFSVAELDDEALSSYRQLAEYAENFMPELIRYYDEAGEAVLNMGAIAKDVANEEQESMLIRKRNQDEVRLYTSIANSGMEQNAKIIQKGYALARIEVGNLKEELISLKQDSLHGVDRTEEIEAVTQQLEENMKSIKDIGKAWNDNIAEPILYSTEGFRGLDTEIQNSMRNMVSYSSMISSNLDEEGFISTYKNVAEQVSQLSEGTLEDIKNMSEGLRDELFVNFTDFSPEQLEGITDSTFLDMRIQNVQVLQEENEKYIEQKEILEELKEKQKLDPVGSRTDFEANNMRYDFDVAGINEKLDSPFDDVVASAEEVNEKIKEIEGSINKTTKAIENSSYNMTNSMRKAAQDPASFNAIRDKVQEMQNEMNNLDPNTTAYKDLQLQAETYYASLMGSDEDYYKRWREVNTAKLAEIQATYGIQADDYGTLNEFMDEMDSLRAQAKILREVALAGDEEEIQNALFEMKRDNIIEELGAEEDATKLKKFLSMSEAEQKIYIAHEEAKAKLETIKQELEAGEISSEEALKQSAAVYGELETHARTFTGKLEAAAASAGVSMGGISGAFGVGVYKDSFVKNASKRIDELIGKIDDSQKAALDAVSVSDAVDEALSMAEDIESKLAGLGPAGLGKLPGAQNVGPMKRPQNKLSGGGGGKSPKAKKEKAEKEVEDLELDLDPLKVYNDRIEQLNHKLELLNDERDRLYGVDKIKNLNQEAEVNREILKTEEAKLKKAKELAKEQRKSLGDRVKYNADGTIKNYNEVLEQMQNSANKLTGEAKENAKKSVEEYKKAMDEYEKYALETVNNVEKNISKIRSELADIAREKIEYPITLIIDKGTQGNAIIDILTDAKAYKKGKLVLTLEADKSSQQLSKTMETVQEMLKQTSGGKGFLDSVLGDGDLTQEQQMEMIDEQIERMSDLGKSLIDFANQFRDAFAEALEEAISIFDAEIEKYESISFAFERMLEVTDALGRTSISSLTETYAKLSDIQRNNIAQTKIMADTIKDSRDSFDKGTDEWKEANAKYLTMQQKVLEQEAALSELLGRQFDGIVSQGYKDLESVLFDGMTLEEARDALEEMHKHRDKYYDTEEKIYNLSKLEKEINKDIKELQDDPDMRAKLEEFRDKEMKHLKNKEKISKTDLELSRKQYAVRKAQIDMERAREAESMKVILTRASDGSYSYMYAQDEKNQDELMQKYQDAINDLYEFSMEKTKELQEESVNIRENALNSYEKIAQKLRSGAITEEEAVGMLNDEFEKMNKLLRENAREQAEMQQQASTAKLLQILGVTEDELGNLDDIGESLQTVFDILESSGERIGLNEVFEELGLNAQDYAGTVGEQIEKMYKDLGGDEGALTKILDAFTESGEFTAATIIALLQETGDISSMTEKIIEDSLAGSGEAFDKLMEDLSSGAISVDDLFTETIIDGLGQMENTWMDLKDIIMVDLDRFVAEFDIENPSSALGQVTENIINAYQEYHDSLEETFNHITESEKELAESIDDLNISLENTVIGLQKEIKEVTKLAQKYQALRNEILKSIEEVTKYIKLLEKARNETYNAKKPKPTKPTSGGSSSSSGSSGSSSSSSGSGKTLGTGQRVRLTGSTVYVSSYDSSPIRLNDAYRGNRNDLYIDGQSNGKYRVRQKGAGWVGWFNPNQLQAFHTGGKVGIDTKQEGMAILKKNEAVLTEKQAGIISRISQILDNSKGIQNFEKNNGTLDARNIVINASFPNATDSKEIEKAFLTMSSSMLQKKKSK